MTGISQDVSVISSMFSRATLAIIARVVCRWPSSSRFLMNWKLSVSSSNEVRLVMVHPYHSCQGNSAPTFRA